MHCFYCFKFEIQLEIFGQVFVFIIFEKKNHRKVLHYIIPNIFNF